MANDVYKTNLKKASVEKHLSEKRIFPFFFLILINPTFLENWFIAWNSNGYIFGLRTVPTNSKVFLRGLLNMREKQISTSVVKIKKENWG